MASNGSEGKTNRRRFLGAAVAAAASYRRVLGANDRIRIALKSATP
jgi:hypothetical protein